jgi:hypothetical protein
MPFCRKCGRRLPAYSESCPECKTSTTGPLINLKKTQAKSHKTAGPSKIVKAVIPRKDIIISVKVIDQAKPAKTVVPSKTAVVTNSNVARIPPKPTTPAEVYPTHEIKQSKVSLKEDIVSNPHDYETQTFDFNLQCPNNHSWRSGKALPVSNGKAFCPKCGEPLSKTKPKGKKRYRTRF